jgi:hypothetical protein
MGIGAPNPLSAGSLFWNGPQQRYLLIADIKSSMFADDFGLLVTSKKIKMTWPG